MTGNAHDLVLRSNKLAQACSGRMPIEMHLPEGSPLSGNAAAVSSMPSARYAPAIFAMLPMDKPSKNKIVYRTAAAAAGPCLTLGFMNN